MKRCPSCNTTYTDDSLRFCLADGGILEDVDTEAETVFRPGVRVDIEQPASVSAPITVAQTKTRTSTVVKIVIALFLLGFLGLLAIGGAGVLYYMNSAGSPVAERSPTPSPSLSPIPTPTATPQDEDDDLEKEITNLQKQLEDLANAQPGKTPGTSRSDDGPIAIVNSPNDGFLALRDKPDAENGKRLAKIPHAAVVTLENCEKERVKIGTRTGRWCMVTYQGQSGWVFDAWLIY